MAEVDLYPRLLAHDEDALTEFFDLYKDIFLKIARDILEPTQGNTEIEDCIAESIVYIWYNIEKFDPKKSSLKNWGLLIIRSRALNKHRDLSKRRKREMQVFPKGSVDIEDIILADETYKQILSHINSFKEPMKEIIKRKCIDGERPKEIAQAMNLNIVKVNYYIYEGTKKLKGLILNG